MDQSSVSHLASSQSLVSSQSISLSVQKTGLGSPGPRREFVTGCAHRHSRDTQLHHGCNCGQTWPSYLKFTFHSLCHGRATRRCLSWNRHGKRTIMGLPAPTNSVTSHRLLLSICNQIYPPLTNPKYFFFFHLLMWQFLFFPSVKIFNIPPNSCFRALWHKEKFWIPDNSCTGITGGLS